MDTNEMQAGSCCCGNLALAITQPNFVDHPLGQAGEEYFMSVG